MNKSIKERLIQLENILRNSDLTERQHFRICNKLDRLMEYIQKEVI